MVARLAPVRTGRGFGIYHALTGGAALPAGLALRGALSVGRRPDGALGFGRGDAGWRCLVWLAITRRHRSGRWLETHEQALWLVT